MSVQAAKIFHIPRCNIIVLELKEQCVRFSAILWRGCRLATNWISLPLPPECVVEPIVVDKNAI